MIILNVTYQCKSGKREEYLKAIKTEGIDVACRAEEGNIAYDYYYPTDDNDTLFLLEKWRDERAFASHREQAHFKRLGELKEEYVDDTAIEKYEVEG